MNDRARKAIAYLESGKTDVTLLVPPHSHPHIGCRLPAAQPERVLQLRLGPADAILNLGGAYR